MKHWLIGLLIGVVLFAFGFMAFQTYAFYSAPEEYETGSYFMPGMRGGCYYNDTNEEDIEYDYDFLYLHLSLEDQATIDLMYADMLLEYDFDSLTQEEQLQVIHSIKEELATYIIDNFSVPYWYESTD